MKFSVIFSNLIKISELKPKELSERIGYDVSYISKWSTGKLLPSAKTADSLFQTMADAFTEKIWYFRKEEQLRDMFDRRVPLETEESVYHVVYRMLRDSFNLEKSENEGKYPENTYIFIEGSPTETILSIITKLVPKSRTTVTIYCSVNFKVMLREFLFNLDKMTAAKDITYNIKVLLPPDGHMLMKSEDRFHIFSLLGKMTIFNIDFYQTKTLNSSDYIYIEIAGGTDGVILLNKTIDDETFLLSYSTDYRVKTEFQWRNELFFKDENKIVTSSEDKYFEYSNLISCLYPNNEITVFTTYLESMFISKHLLNTLIRSRNISEQEVLEMRKLRNLYEIIARDKPIQILIPKAALIRKVKQKEIVVGKYKFQLDEQEWQIYKEDIYNACIENEKIRFVLLQENMLPISVRQMSIFVVVNNRRCWIKKDPSYLDEFTKPYLNVIEQRMVNNLRCTMQDFNNSSFIEKVDLIQFMQYISNIESIT